MKIRKKLIDFFFPKYCLKCQSLGSFLCRKCQQKIKRAKTACFLCKKENQFGEICPLCLYYQGEKAREWFVNNLIWTASYRQKICKNLITSLKYKGVEEIANILALLLNNKINNTWPNIEADLFYIPNNKSQEKRRGYNQTKLIAEILAKLNPKLHINHNLITKKFKQRQTTKNIKKRWENLNEFAYQGKSLLNKNVIIVDDLASSGATLNQIAKCIKSHKPKSIRGAVVFKG